MHIGTEIKKLLEKDYPREQVESLLRDVDLSSIFNILEAVEKQDSFTLKEAINSLSQCAIDHRVRQEQHERLGHLARQFQQSLISFRDGLGARIHDAERSQGYAQNQIEAVIKSTHDSAMMVMEIGQNQIGSFNELIDKTKSLEDLLELESNNDNFNSKFKDLSNHVLKIKVELDNYNQHLLMSQSYQDITGQILIRVKTFIDSIENGLIEIVKMLAYDCIDEQLKEIDTQKILNNCDQGDVDELLSSLGF